ncbi:hypothetical protein BDF14DRAFT_1832260 [Spinellus fusiger]|nr:hypothetical protein BDF14DRAFT_1832260 [Spinellus fusiger]
MECKASKLSKLKITSSKGYYLIVHIIEPDSFNSMEVAVVFGNEIISGLLGVSHKEVIRLSKEAGSDDILKKIIRQLHEKLLSSRANVELDLSLMVNDASGFPTPRVLHYLIQ